MRKFITFLFIVALLGTAGYFIYRWQIQQQASTTSNFQTVAAQRGELIATIGATGRVRSNQTAMLYWKVAGTVEQVYVQVGDPVRVGDKLADLEGSSLPQNVILAQSDLVNAQKALDDLYTAAESASIQAMQSIANYTQAVKSAQYQLDNFTPPMDQADLGTMEAVDLTRKNLDAARAAFEPYKYYPSGDTTRQDLKEALDEAQSAHNSAVKRLEYEYQLAVATSNLDRARQDYEKWKSGPDPKDVAAIESRLAAAEATLRQAWIEAPFGGTITLVIPKPGDQVAPNSQAFRLDDLSTLYVDVDLSEIDINQIKVGQDATMTFDAIPDKEYHGKVVEVSQVGTAIQDVVDFTVTIELTDADGDVKPAMTAAVNIVAQQLEDVLLVPNRAVRIVEGSRTVYILQNGQLVPVAITLGASSDVSSEVLEGDLHVGDAIVLNPPTVFESNGPPPFVRR